MIIAIGFVIVAVIIIVALFLINNFIIRKNSTDKAKNIFRIIISIIVSLIAGGIGFFLTFALGEGLMGIIDERTTMSITITFISVFNFVACLFIGRFYYRSIWFAWFLINPFVWLVLIINPAGSGGFIDLWWGWAAFVIFAFIGSLTGFLISRKKSKKPDNVYEN